MLGFTGGFLTCGFWFDSQYQDQKSKIAELQSKLADATQAVNYAQEQQATVTLKWEDIHKKDQEALKAAQDKAEAYRLQVEAAKSVIAQNEKTIKELQDKLASTPSTGEVKVEPTTEEAPMETSKTFDATIKRAPVPVSDDGKKELEDARAALQKAYAARDKWDSAKTHNGQSRPKEASAQYIADLENKVRELEFKYGN